MEKKFCPCGGTFQNLGRREIRMGPTSPLKHNTFDNYSLEAELFVCDCCHELKLFLPEELAFELTHSPEERYLREFADASDAELRRIAEKSYHPEARRAAAALRKSSPSVSSRSRCLYSLITPSGESTVICLPNWNSQPQNVGAIRTCTVASML